MSQNVERHDGENWIPYRELEEASLADLQQLMAERSLGAEQLVGMYLSRIHALDRNGPRLNSIIETNPEALDQARTLDLERHEHGSRGPLHGIPILLKDNIGTNDLMSTSAGSLALAGVHSSEDAFVAQKLRAAGAILFGKANMSEWANFRSTRSTSGWSARGGQGLNPYALDSTPSGSSSGSASAVAANLVPVALGTETDGSILCPASVNGVVGVKPTVGLTSRSGVIPISLSQDSVGPIARTVADAARILGIIAGTDLQDSVTASAPHPSIDYMRFLDPLGLEGARIGVPRDVYWGYSPAADKVAEDALDAMRSLGAVIIDPADIPTAGFMKNSWPPSDDSKLTMLLYEFKATINAYLQNLDPSFAVRSLDDLIDFNERHADLEMPYFGQELFLMAQGKGPLSDSEYVNSRKRNLQISRAEGLDAVLDEYELDALVMPTTAPAWKIDLVNGGGSPGNSARPSALAGYPAVNVPAGDVFGLPVGITFAGRAFSEPVLLRLAFAYEQATQFRRPPQYQPPSVYPSTPNRPANYPSGESV